MIKSTVVFLALFLSLSAWAKDSAHRCVVSGWDDYSVEINWTSDKAAFFDNNDWAVVPFANDDFFAYVMMFEGVDKQGDEIRISYEYSGLISPPQHSVEFVSDGQVQRASLSCKAVTPSELLSGI